MWKAKSLRRSLRASSHRKNPAKARTMKVIDLLSFSDIPSAFCRRNLRIRLRILGEIGSFLMTRWEDERLAPSNTVLTMGEFGGLGKPPVE